MSLGGGGGGGWGRIAASLVWISSVSDQMLCLWNKSLLTWSCGRFLKIVSVIRLVKLVPLASYLVTWVQQVGERTPSVSYSPPACLVWPGLVLKLPLIHHSWSVEFLQPRAFEKVDFLKVRFRFLLVRWLLWSLLVVSQLDFWCWTGRAG